MTALEAAKRNLLEAEAEYQRAPAPMTTSPA